MELADRDVRELEAVRGRGYVELWTAPNALVRGLSSLHTRTGSAPAWLVLPPFSLAGIGPG